jgi:hypothetical protein
MQSNPLITLRNAKTGMDIGFACWAVSLMRRPKAGLESGIGLALIVGDIALACRMNYNKRNSQ